MTPYFTVGLKPGSDGRWYVRRHVGPSFRTHAWYATQAEAIAAAAELNHASLAGEPVPAPDAWQGELREALAGTAFEPIRKPNGQLVTLNRWSQR